MDKIKVTIYNPQKDIRIQPGIRLLIRRCCTAVLKLENFEGSAEVTVTLANENDIHQLNKQHLEHDYVTDVLSFPLGENGVWDVNPETGYKMLGDIVICVQKAAAQAELYGHSFQREIGYLTVHSMLHLLGYDHVQGGIEQVRMREKEEEVLNELGLPRSGSYATIEE